MGAGYRFGDGGDSRVGSPRVLKGIRQNFDLHGAAFVLPDERRPRRG